MKQRKFEPQRNKYLCKCGHRIAIPSFKDKKLCDWCGEYVFSDKKKEFEYRLIEKRNKVLA